MHPVVVGAAVVAAAIHAWFFALESLWFPRATVWRRFGLRSEDEARIARSWAFNQGFYNLFLTAGVIGGLLLSTVEPASGRAVVAFACASMVAAGVVLVAYNRRFARAAATQAVPPLIALVGLLVLR
jgi:putative membrane protein